MSQKYIDQCNRVCGLFAMIDRLIMGDPTCKISQGIWFLYADHHEFTRKYGGINE